MIKLLIPLAAVTLLTGASNVNEEVFQEKAPIVFNNAREGLPPITCGHPDYIGPPCENTVPEPPVWALLASSLIVGGALSRWKWLMRDRRKDWERKHDSKR